MKKNLQKKIYISKIINNENVGESWIKLNEKYDFKKNKNNALFSLLGVIFYFLITFGLIVYLCLNIYFNLKQPSIQIKDTILEYFIIHQTGKNYYFVGILSALFFYLIIFPFLYPLCIRFLNYHFWLKSKTEEKKIKAILSSLLSYFEFRNAYKIVRVTFITYILIWFKKNEFEWFDNIKKVAVQIQCEISSRHIS